MTKNKYLSIDEKISMAEFGEATPMADKNANQRLGRGLAALIGEPKIGAAATPGVTVFAENSSNPSNADVYSDAKKVPIEYISVNPRNPRKHFEQEDLDNLSISLKQQGMIQPILVRSQPNSSGLDASGARFEIIAGERRWRAAQLAGLHEVPIIVRELDDKQSLEVAIVENVQRTDLNPLEEAEGYAQLIQEFDYTQSDLGEIIGKSRSHVTNMLRLMKLPVDVRDYILTGALTAGHARALINSDNPSELAKLIVDKGLSVRAAEKLRQKESETSVRQGLATMDEGAAKSYKDPNIKAIEDDLSAHIGMPVTVKGSGASGDVVISFKNLDQFDYIVQRLKSE